MHKSRAIHSAYTHGDLDALKTLLGNPPDFPNCQAPPGMGESILEYVIYHSPLPFIRKLLEVGANPNCGDHAGFPSLIAVLSNPDRSDMYEIVELLLSFGADIQQRGHNDYTPLHYAAAKEDIRAMELLLTHGADLSARTRIDDYATPLEEMEILGREEAVTFLKKTLSQ